MKSEECPICVKEKLQIKQPSEWGDLRIVCTKHLLSQHLEIQTLIRFITQKNDSESEAIRRLLTRLTELDKELKLRKVSPIWLKTTWRR